MSLLVGFSESSGGRVRRFTQPASSSSPSRLATLTYRAGVNNRPVGGSGSETSHPIDMINDHDQAVSTQISMKKRCIIILENINSTELLYRALIDLMMDAVSASETSANFYETI
jgi:hypothetical protein